MSNQGVMLRLCNRRRNKAAVATARLWAHCQGREGATRGSEEVERQGRQRHRLTLLTVCIQGASASHSAVRAHATMSSLH